MDYEEIRKEIVKVTKELIRFRTTDDRIDELRRCINFVKDYFKDSKVHIWEFCFKDKPCLFISLYKRKKQKLIFNGHIDIVEGYDTEFEPSIKGNKLFGRGSYDMKSSVACFMVLMKNLSNMKKPPRVGLMVVSDEEIGGPNCTRNLLKKGFVSNFCITGETTNFYLETKHKGVMQIKLTAYGSSSHASRPWQGDNAIDKLYKQYQKLISEIPQATKTSKWLPTVNVTNIISQGPFNVTPSKAEMILDIRTTEDFGNRKIVEMIKKLNVKYKKVIDANMMTNDKKDKYIKSLRDVISKKVGKRIKYIKSCGGSDSRFFTAKGIPAVNFGPRGKNHHKHNEYVEIPSLEDYYWVLEKFIKDNIK